MTTTRTTPTTFVISDSGVVHYGVKWAEIPGYVMTDCWAGKSGRLSGKATTKTLEVTCKRCVKMYPGA